MNGLEFFFLEKICSFYCYWIQTIETNLHKTKFLILESRNFFPSSLENFLIFFSNDEILIGIPNDFFFKDIYNLTSQKIPKIRITGLQKISEEILKKKDFSEHSKIGFVVLPLSDNIAVSLQIFELCQFFKKNFIFEDITYSFKNFESKFSQKSLILSLKFNFLLLFSVKKIFKSNLIRLLTLKNVSSIFPINSENNLKKNFKYEFGNFLILIKIERAFDLYKNVSKINTLKKSGLFSFRIANKIFNKNSLIFFEKFFFINPKLKILNFYQIFSKVNKIFIENLIKKKKTSKKHFCQFFHVLSESTCYKFLKILNYKKKDFDKGRQNTFFGKFLKEKEYFMNFVEKKKKKLNIYSFQNFTLSPRGILIPLFSAIFSEKIKKMTFYFRENSNIQYKNKFRKKKKIDEIKKITIFIKKKTTPEINRYLFEQKKNLFRSLLVEKRNFQIFRPQKNTKNNLFFLSGKRDIYSYFFNNYWFCSFFWGIKKIITARKGKIFLIKIDFFNWKSTKSKTDQSDNLLNIFFFSKRKVDIKKIKRKFLIFHQKIKNKNQIEKKKDKFLTITLFHINLIELKKIYYRETRHNMTKQLGKVQLHSNGLYFITEKERFIEEIYYQKINKAFYQVDAKKKKIILNIFFDEKQNYSLFGKISNFQLIFEQHMPEINLERKKESSLSNSEIQEKFEDKKFQRCVTNFNLFINCFSKLSGKNIEILKSDNGFYGVDQKKLLFFTFFKNCLTCLSEFPPIVMRYSNINFLYFERLDSDSKNFDLVLVYKNLKDKKIDIKAFWRRILIIPHKKLAFFILLSENFFLPYFSGPSTLNWNLILEIFRKKGKNLIKKNGFDRFEKKKFLKDKYILPSSPKNLLNFKTKLKENVLDRKSRELISHSDNLCWEDLLKLSRVPNLS